MHWLAASCLNLKISPAASVTCCFKIARTHLLLRATLVPVSESITGQTTTDHTWAEQYVTWTQTIKHRYEIVCICVHTSRTAYHSSPCNFKKNLAISQVSSIGSDGGCPNLEVFSTDLCHRCAPTKHHKVGKQQAIALVAMNMGSFSAKTSSFAPLKWSQTSLLKVGFGKTMENY